MVVKAGDSWPRERKGVRTRLSCDRVAVRKCEKRRKGQVLPSLYLAGDTLQRESLTWYLTYHDNSSWEVMQSGVSVWVSFPGRFFTAP